MRNDKTPDTARKKGPAEETSAGDAARARCDRGRAASPQHSYQYLYENAPVGICISTLDGEVIAANPAFYRLFKLPDDCSVKVNLVKDNLYCFIIEREHILERLDKTGYVRDYEATMRAADGSVLTVSISATRFEESGGVYFESILIDVTERRRLEAELRTQKEGLEEKVRRRTAGLVRQKDRLIAMNREIQAQAVELRNSVNRIQTLFNAITDHVIAMDTDYRVTMTNRDATDVGKTCHEALFGRSEPCRKCPGRRALQTGKKATIELESGDSFFQLQCYPVFNARGRLEGIIEWAKDITQERNLCSQMLQADRLASLGQLVSGIGHEINNPNTFILGNMKILREAFMDILPLLDEYSGTRAGLKIARLDYPFFKQHVELLVDDMVSGAERIKTIVQDLKKFARGSESRRDEAVSLNEVVSRSVRLVQNQVKRKARIVTALDEKLPAICANSTGLEQLLVNLIINASDAVLEGERGTIRISTAPDPQGDAIALCVRDDGCGMDDATMRQMFNPFFTTKRNRGGTGLGLSIAYRIIKEHDGEIEVDSAPGKGTTFRIKLPVSAS